MPLLPSSQARWRHLVDKPTASSVLILSARALGKIDTHGSPRGVTMLTTHEIEAMALLLAALGLSPIQPGEPPPADALALFNR